MIEIGVSMCVPGVVIETWIRNAHTFMLICASQPHLPGEMVGVRVNQVLSWLVVLTSDPLHQIVL